MTIPLWVGILLLFAGGIIGFMAACFCFACRRGDEIVEEVMGKEERFDIIQEAFDKYGDCDHDVIEPTSDVPGEHHVSYYIEKRGKEKILEVL